MNHSNHRPIALALSGGGVRAMVFHLGVIKYLAERNLLECVTHISTVSGGSLIIGLIMQENGNTWPSSTEYLERIVSTLRGKLCSRSLMGGALRQLARLKNWKYLLSRSNLVSLALKTEWGITGKLSEMSSMPEWSINGTTAETGKRFRFKRENFGDWVIGYAMSDQFPLSDALAVSAAFPGGIGPLAINAKDYQWTMRDWGAPKESAAPVEPAYSRLHLYDGGVYDNLGVEPYFDSGRRRPKPELPNGTAIVVSDAGAPLQKGFSLTAMNPWRLKRVADIMSEQARALRVRSFVSYIHDNPQDCVYLYIAQSLTVRTFTEPKTGEPVCESAKFASEFPTSLNRLSEDQFDRIFMHGLEVTRKFDNEIGI